MFTSRTSGQLVLSFCSPNVCAYRPAYDVIHAGKGSSNSPKGLSNVQKDIELGGLLGLA